MQTSILTVLSFFIALICQGNSSVIAQDQYKVQVNVTTRAGGIPVRNVVVTLDGTDLGRTNPEGVAPNSGVKTSPNLSIEVVYENDAENVKEEVFTLALSNINASAETATAGESKNCILKVQDVFGSGATGFPGDLDFVDRYSDTDAFEFVDSGDANVKVLRVNVKLATLSLDVPYSSQVGDPETITIRPPVGGTPAVTHDFRGSVICMPTSAKMCTDYWQILDSGGGELSRNEIMQACWNQGSNQSVDFPCPWQNWAHLRTVIGGIAQSSNPNTYSVTRGPAATSNSASIPSTYADGIRDELESGCPVATSTYATAGHVMVVRGAVVDHDDHVQWLIFNDPNGNLASVDSIYGTLDITAAVGRRGNGVGVMNRADDLRAVREALTKLGHFNGSLDGPIDEASDTDPTIVAIRALQGGANPDGRVDPGGRAERLINTRVSQNASPAYSAVENERNSATGANSERGRHVYYSGTTEGRGVNNGGLFRLKTQAWTLVVDRNSPLTVEQVSARTVGGD